MFVFQKITYLSAMWADSILYIALLLSGLYMAWSIGANDVANAMGTSVGSGALTLRRAVVIAAVLEFSGAFFFGENVAETIESGIVHTHLIAPRDIVLGMLAALMSSAIWLQLATYRGWPVSTTHAIIGAVAGFGFVAAGVEGVQWLSLVKIATSWTLSPFLGGIFAFALFTLIRKTIFYTHDPVEATKRIAPRLAAALATLIALFFIENGMMHGRSEGAFFSNLLIALSFGAVAFLGCTLWVKRILPERHKKTESIANPETARCLQKAQKHLRLAQSTVDPEAGFRIQGMLSEIESLGESLEKKGLFSTSHEEYLLVEKIFSYFQIASACLMAFSHGSNDVANAIGPLSAALMTLQTGSFPAFAPISGWLLALGGLGIVVGLATWGWRVILTIGSKITELTPTRGFSAEAATAFTVLVATQLGLPVSTTHILVGAVVGVGLARGIEALNLSIAKDIVISWLVTVPIGAAFSSVLFIALRVIFS